MLRFVFLVGLLLHLLVPTSARGGVADELSSDDKACVMCQFFLQLSIAEVTGGNPVSMMANTANFGAFPIGFGYGSFPYYGVGGYLDGWDGDVLLESDSKKVNKTETRGETNATESTHASDASKLHGKNSTHTNAKKNATNQSPSLLQVRSRIEAKHKSRVNATGTPNDFSYRPNTQRFGPRRRLVQANMGLIQATFQYLQFLCQDHMPHPFHEHCSQMMLKFNKIGEVLPFQRADEICMYISMCSVDSYLNNNPHALIHAIN